MLTFSCEARNLRLDAQVRTPTDDPSTMPLSQTGPERTNEDVADRLREAADLLEQQGANPYRVAAYRRAADTVVDLGRDLGNLYRKGGLEGLTALPTVGAGIAGAIRELLETGRWSQLERLRGSVEPERLFRAIPGVGPTLARRIHGHLDVESLEALEVAAHDGRLERVPGIGGRRSASIRASLQAMLGRVRRGRRAPAADPSVDVLLDVDREYRERARLGDLPTIAPRRFNPDGRSWLPVLHTERPPWNITVLFSNTARAHELGTTRDWVVIYFQSDDTEEGQHTVVTETRGELAGKRVVRGREGECRRHYGLRTP